MLIPQELQLSHSQLGYDFSFEGLFVLRNTDSAKKNTYLNVMIMD